MRPTEDYAHAFRGSSGVRSVCRVRLYLPDAAVPGEALGDAPVVVVSELSDNPGTSVTNAIEQLTAEVMDAYALGCILVFVEHYPSEATGGREETFDLIVFGHHEVREIVRGDVWRKEIGPPTWKPLDRHAVEILVGSSV